MTVLPLRGMLPRIFLDLHQFSQNQWDDGSFYTINGMTVCVCEIQRSIFLDGPLLSQYEWDDRAPLLAGLYSVGCRSKL